jgi:RNA polymerase sigma factor (sigma-70 family)
MSRVLHYGGQVSAPLRPGSSLTAVFVRHRAAIERYLRARGAGDATEDLVQELWLKLASLPADLEIGDPVSYLFRIGHNLMLDRYRAEARRGAREQHYLDVSDQGGAGIDPAPSAHRAIHARDRLRRVRETLAALGERTDHIFRRHRIEGIGQQQIAAELGISLSAVEKHLQKAYKAVHLHAREGGVDDDLA